MKYCQHCGNPLEEGQIICSYCGADAVPTKFCKHCGQKIDAKCVVCPKCGKQVEELSAQTTSPIVINNTNTNTNTNANINAAPVRYRPGKMINKWVAFLLCLFLGEFGAHKFYEGKIVMGLIYLFTFGLLGIGWLVDLIVILTKPNPYYINR